MQTYVYNNALTTPELSNHRVKSIFFEKVNSSFPMEVRREKLVTCLFVSLLNPSYKNFILLARTAPGLFEKESAKVSARTISSLRFPRAIGATMPRFLSSANPAKDYRPAATFAPITRLYLPGPNVCFSLHGHVECVRGSDCTPVAHSFRNVRSTLVAKGKVNSCRVTMEASGRKRSFGDRSICLRLGRGEGDALLAGDNRPFFANGEYFPRECFIVARSR